MDLLSLVSLGVFTFTYGMPMRLVAITAQRRYEYRTGQRLHWAWACVYGALWPVLMAIWIVAVLVLPPEKRPASLVYEPSKADRAAVEMDRRKEERSLAIQDWQARASHWFGLGKKAEEENDQALKWAVAENLTFLLETKPEGAKVKGLTKPEGSQVSPETGEEIVEIDWEEVRKSIEKKAVTHFGIPQAKLAEDRVKIKKRTVPNIYAETNSVEFCNACARYREYDDMTMKGMCDECSAEQGIR